MTIAPAPAGVLSGMGTSGSGVGGLTRALSAVCLTICTNASLVAPKSLPAICVVFRVGVCRGELGVGGEAGSGRMEHATIDTNSAKNIARRKAA